MRLRCRRRTKDGKSHEYCNGVESRRLADGRIAQRQVLYLGEINASQREAWRKTIELNEQRYRRANRIWVMDRGIPTEDSGGIEVKVATHNRISSVANPFAL